MKSGPSNPRCCTASHAARPRGRSGFTLAETLAALLFLAIVIPVAIQAIQLASYAGQVGQRKIIAARIGDRILNDLVASGTWQGGTGSGMSQEGPLQFRWSTKVESWPEGTLRLLTVDVTFPVQGREQDVRLSTLVSSTSP